MAKLKTTLSTSLAQMMIARTDPTKSLIDEFRDEVLRLLPRGTQMVGLNEIPYTEALYRKFELIFDAPYFQKDFEFEVEFIRQILDDGTGQMHTYQMATKIIRL